MKTLFASIAAAGLALAVRAAEKITTPEFIKETGMIMGSEDFSCYQRVRPGAFFHLGAGMTAVWAFGTGLAIFFTLKKLGILRVSAKTELKGLDLTEHGQDAYASFQFFSNT